jgi:hypothetical protein
VHSSRSAGKQCHHGQQMSCCSRQMIITELLVPLTMRHKKTTALAYPHTCTQHTHACMHPHFLFWLPGVLVHNDQHFLSFFKLFFTQNLTFWLCQVYWFTTFNSPPDAPQAADADGRQAEALALVDGWRGGIVEAIRATPAHEVTRSRLGDRCAWVRMSVRVYMCMGECAEGRKECGGGYATFTSLE